MRHECLVFDLYTNVKCFFLLFYEVLVQFTDTEMNKIVTSLSFIFRCQFGLLSCACINKNKLYSFYRATGRRLLIVLMIWTCERLFSEESMLMVLRNLPPFSRGQSSLVSRVCRIATISTFTWMKNICLFMPLSSGQGCVCQWHSDLYLVRAEEIKPIFIPVISIQWGIDCFMVWAQTASAYSLKALVSNGLCATQK